jgi:hypothetical protein
MKGNNNISGATSSTYSATSAGNYFVVVTNSSGCSATSAAVVVTVGTGATATITPTGTVIVCAGSATTLSANTGAGITYQWYRNSAAISGATSSTYAASSSGTYYVTESSTCGNATSNSVIVNSINNPVPAISYTTPLAFCSPGSVLLTANTFSGVGFQWQKNSVDIVGATSQTYSATSNGAYRVKETANGCYKYAPAVSTTTATTVTAAITASGPTTFCTGGSVILSVTNAISGYSYQWKKNNTNISGAILSSYTATTAGSYTCYISATCGNATSNTITVSTGGITALVNPAGSVTICSGATVAFSANTGTGYTYQWKLNGSNISGATLSSYTATTVGNYTVAIASPCGNATSTATTVSVSNVTATVTPSGTTTICAGGATTFTANTGYNFAYQWYRNTGAIGGATNATYGASSNGNYTVKITQGGVCSATSSISILVVTNNPTPSITAGGPTTFCAGQSVTLTANTFAGVIYEWQKNSAAISGATAQTYVATTAGAYRVKETANGCAKYAVALSVVVNCRVMGGQGHWAGAGESENKIVLSPNPTNGKLKLETGNLNGGEIKIRVLDVLGKEVFSTQFTNSDETNVHEMDLSNLINGIYFLQVNTDRGSVVKKFIKQ